MKIVVDSNRIIAAIIKDNVTRQIIFNKKFEFFAPSYIFTEIKKYKDYIIRKTGISNEELDVILSLIFENIEIVEVYDYNNLTNQLKDEIVDSKDIPYLAVAIFTKADGIWTHDIHFKEQDKIKVFSNFDMLKSIDKKD